MPNLLESNRKYSTTYLNVNMQIYGGLWSAASRCCHTPFLVLRSTIGKKPSIWLPYVHTVSIKWDKKAHLLTQKLTIAEFLSNILLTLARGRKLSSWTINRYCGIFLLYGPLPSQGAYFDLAGRIDLSLIRHWLESLYMMHKYKFKYNSLNCWIVLVPLTPLC